MMPSDEQLKKDIEARRRGTGRDPVYKYRFKGALAGSPKQGPMAQDVQKVVPQAVSNSRFRRQAADPHADARGHDGAARLRRRHAVRAAFARRRPVHQAMAKALKPCRHRPPTKFPRGATIPMMPKRFAGGIAAVPGDGPDDTVPHDALGSRPDSARPSMSGRPKIAALNAVSAWLRRSPPVGSGASDDGTRAGARGCGRTIKHQASPEDRGGLSG